MSEAKTQPTEASVADHLATRANPTQLADCKVLMDILGRVTKQQPRMWGPSIVGYGRYEYRNQNGKPGQSCATGFAVRGRKLVVYLVAEGPDQGELLSRLGKHEIGKSCLYIQRLADVDTAVLEQLVASSFAEVHRRYPTTGEV